MKHYINSSLKILFFIYNFTSANILINYQLNLYHFFYRENCYAMCNMIGNHIAMINLFLLITIICNYVGADNFEIVINRAI